MALQDAQARLFFKAQSVIQSEIRYYTPTAQDLAYRDIPVDKYRCSLSAGRFEDLYCHPCLSSSTGVREGSPTPLLKYSSMDMGRANLETVIVKADAGRPIFPSLE